MGYQTEFTGKVKLSKQLNASQIEFIKRFQTSRRMGRDEKVLAKLDPDFKFGFNGSHGTEGEYFVGDHDYQESAKYAKSIIDGNKPPKYQPGLWCQWTVSEDGKYLLWDGGEKFYEYDKWLKYLINNFFKPWKIALKGKIRWRGEQREDKGVLVVEGNKVSALSPAEYKEYAQAIKKLKHLAALK
jgi:hypothetical protein